MRQTEGASKTRVGRFPRWGFTVLAGGGFWASGLYAGMLRAGEASVGNIAGAIGFGMLGLVMLWGALGSR